MEELNDAVMALNLTAMTEEDARLKAIELTETYITKVKSDARTELGCNIVMALFFALVFGADGAGIDGPYQYIDYRKARRLLRKFQAGTYRKSYLVYLADWQKQITQSRKAEATSLEKRIQKGKQH